MPRKKIEECPRCGYSDELAELDAVRFGGSRFVKNMVSITAMETGVKGVDIVGNPRGSKFTRARVALAVAMRSLGASWELCGEAIGRDKGAIFRLHASWRDEDEMNSHATKILSEYRKQVEG